MSAPEVTIRPRFNSAGTLLGTKVIVQHLGRSYASQFCAAIPDTPSNRQREAQSFLDRLVKFPSGIADYDAKQDLIAHAMSGAPPEPNSHNLAPGEYGAVTPPRRPALSIVKDKR